MSTRNIKENHLDHLAIMDLMNRYTLEGNRRNWTAVADTFAEDGIWDAISPEGEHYLVQGRENVMDKMIIPLVEEMKMVIQANHSHVIDINGDQATAMSQIEERYCYAEGPSVHIFGIYYDDIRKCDDGEWRFARRAFRTQYFEPKDFPGTLVAEYPLRWPR